MITQVKSSIALHHLYYLSTFKIGVKLAFYFEIMASQQSLPISLIRLPKGFMIQFQNTYHHF